MSKNLERRYENLVNGQILIAPSDKAKYLEVLCYAGSVTVTSGWMIDKTFVDDDFDPVTINAVGAKKTATSNLPRSVIRVTNPSAGCKIIIFSYW